MKKVLLTIVMLFSTVFAQTGSITNVTCSQRTDGSKLVDIYYDLSGTESSYNISVHISLDGGNTYSPISNSTGDIDGDVTPGTEKHIIWNAGTDYPAVFSEQAKIEIIASFGIIEGTVTDVDGNVYKTVKIGGQWWMAQNLKVKHYRNGDEIPNITDNTGWTNLTTGAYCNYNNDVNNATTYGSLYNWYAVNDSRSIAPAGWHVPSDAEWQKLVDYLGGASVAGGKMKETGTTHWKSPNTGATNESGFAALPGGYRYYNGTFATQGYYAYFWSSTESSSYTAWYRVLYYDTSRVSRAHYSRQAGFSVRLVRD